MDEYKGILVIAEQNDNIIHKVSYELLNKGRELADELNVPLDCLLLGDDGIHVEELNYRGAETVYYMKSENFSKPEEYLYKQNIVKFIDENKPEIILIGATNFGRSIAPRIAAALKTGLTADCTELQIDDDNNFIQVRPAFSDNILAHIKTVTYPKMATIRYKEFDEAERNVDREINVVKIKPYMDKYDEVEIVQSFNENDVNITEAQIVVATGRAIKKKEDLKMIKDFANKVGGVIGASRALVDAGMIGSVYQVGYSGNRVKPKIYIACGISGAPQHLAGMKESETIIAINSDSSAPIFSIADYGYVGDIYEIIPNLIRDL
ncbi:electron transfer flavoprotein subunit alpha/FixB family protein [Schnuerera sp. xch1]|uniref:electron transfer flavoprotein subunit alpha/FixB family protein n=1 Tax=Schnuerera sp. xch1 TaxID=2874283 RepID=UPI001CBDB1AD|nr:electron transfer flavoprotein subunit alpha/FixB family protein [Schnuerera sp. xch1]MBZ2174535.1 electron transfer flavoprotein subunit alpha/FixB family protein [Schnuerera sp. xch1]